MQINNNLAASCEAIEVNDSTVNDVPTEDITAVTTTTTDQVTEDENVAETTGGKVYTNVLVQEDSAKGMISKTNPKNEINEWVYAKCRAKICDNEIDSWAYSKCRAKLCK